MVRRTILVVDDDPEMRVLLVEVLRREGYDVEEAANGAQLLARLHERSFTAIIVDKNLPGLAGLYLLPGMRVIARETPVIVMTTLPDAATYLNGLKKSAFEYVFKPFRMEELLRVLRRTVPAGDESDASGRAPAEP